MASKRIPTKYPGVYYRLVRRLGGKKEDTEKVYYATWKKDGKKIEACCGREFRDNMTAARANNMRAEFIEGHRQTRADNRREKAANPPLSDLWELYKAAMLHNRQSSASSTSDYRRLPESLTKKRPHEITPKDIAALDKEMIENGLSAQSRKHTLTLIERISRWGVRQQLCKPMSFDIQLPKVDNQKTEFLDDNQLFKLLDALDKDADIESALLVKLIIYTGMRKSAAFSLEWRDIDFEGQHITLRGESAKSGKTQIIPMSKQTKEILQKVSRHKTSSLLFPSSIGEKRWNLPKAFVARVREAAGLPEDFRFLHGLRHSFASRLASGNMINMFLLQRLLTHESPEMTQRYSHLLDDAMRRAGEAIDAAMTPKIDKGHE